MGMMGNLQVNLHPANVRRVLGFLGLYEILTMIKIYIRHNTKPFGTKLLKLESMAKANWIDRHADKQYPRRHGGAHLMVRFDQTSITEIHNILDLCYSDNHFMSISWSS